ncbi:MAG: disulfide bond formation protein B [Marinovum algicola]|jgi:disulfide bond formation protein DsbB|uniref:Disulfide bond formation protein DsbB n=1 Tax=Marinovum algicola TaxID=42444 RepID=A0A975W8A8_9RHOB|nr:MULTISPECIES: disulfide bond formation protein B [Marinovum]AKO96807.1 Disulfide bond formation protein DsbB [Marinovum algicola DG 898]MDD9740753.1 disulfide bond formation protein B [Marinovum sp. SP66]MDD9745259.1 disulfide bond formation protein B [Marinovum sp. PR37]SEJ06419.1 Disulfide bond formation protein DsbB [Marinovum algicola]SLN19226.1 disulfide bond formation protein B [Marinovum algicola]
MTRTSLVLLAAGGSFLLLAGAFLFQALGWAPCAMCLWQRWPHAAAVLIGALALALPGRLLPLLGALAAATTAGIAVFHSGVERKWWQGPASCTGSGEDLGSLTGGDLLPGGSEAPALVLCDSFTPFLFGLTMANWNALFSALLVLVWLKAARAAA